MLIFDVETEGLPEVELRRIMPEYEPEPFEGPAPFDPSAVKTGNLGPVKAKEKIDKAKAEHAAKAANARPAYEARIAEEEAEHWAKIVERAALSAVTGRVLAIGYFTPADNRLELTVAENTATEIECLGGFWGTVSRWREMRGQIVGLNIFDFDLPFLIRRSWMLDVPVPDWVLPKNDRYFDPIFVDLRSRWLLGQGQGDCKSNFDELARAFGTEGKPGGIDGGDFARLWREDRPTAEAYLLNDLKQPAKWAEIMGIY